MKFAQTAFFGGIIIGTKVQLYFFSNISQKTFYNPKVLASNPFLVTPWFCLFFSVAGFPSKITLSGRLLRLFS